MTTHNPVGKAYLNFQNEFFPGGAGKGLYFWRFLGLEYAPGQITRGFHGWDVDKEIQAKILLLASDYGQVIARAMHAAGAPIDKIAE